MPYHNYWLMMSLPKQIFSILISTRVKRSQPTRLCRSTTHHMTSKGIQMLSTFAHDLTSWLLLLKMITPTLINMGDSSTSSQSPSTIKAKSKSRDQRDKRSKCYGCAGLSKTQIIRMGSLIFVSHDCSLLGKTAWLSGMVSSPPLMYCVLPTQFLPLHGILWTPSLFPRVLMQSGSSRKTGTAIM